jgi:putative transposase
MLVAHRIRPAPNNVQASYLARAAGTARFAYNWALAQWQRQYGASKAEPALPKPNEMALRRQLNAIKRADFPWMLEVTKNAPQMAIIQLGRAFDNFFAGRARYPRFRRKGRDDRFTLTNDQLQVRDKRIRIPKLGWVRMRERLRFAGRIVSATVARVADHWYASITVDTTDQGAVGIDLGVTTLATLALRCSLKRLRRLGRAVSRPRSTRVVLPVLRRQARPRRERRGQPQEHGGEFHRDGLWRGRHWPGAQAQGETGPDEAGIHQRS